ncbi:MAG: response regulator, partial [Pseudomonadota bacterium]
VHIEITDTGIGIPEDKLNSIFNAFEQVDSRYTRKFDGTGLGLAICRQLVTLMGGEVAVRSEIGRGSMFTVDLALEPVGAPPETQPILSGRRILVLDALAKRRAIREEQLRALGATVAVTASLEEALARMEAAQAAGADFDAAVVDDASVPPECLDRLAVDLNAATKGPLPILLLIAVNRTLDAARLVREAGFSEVLSKPVRLADKVAALARMLNLDAVTPPHAREVALSDATPPLDLLDGLDIIVAEDNTTNQLVICKLLDRHGARIRLCNNGREALDAFEARRPALVLMDVSMPVMNGLDATRAIRAVERRQGRTSCAIIALTANAMTEDRLACLDAGMDEVLTKPLRRKELFACLAKFERQLRDVPRYARA